MKILLTLLSLITTTYLLSAQSVTESWSSEQNGVYSYSSPRAVDLTGDGIKDIVLGAGLENQASTKGIIAVNGSTGETLWTVPTNNQIYASPIFQDINNDGVEDVFIGGREAEFYAVSGADGTIIWAFFSESDIEPIEEGWYNFYSPQWLPDQNNDGYKDLLLANGGDYNATVLNQDRPQGNILVVSGANGEILAQAGVPDEKETYMSPLVVDFYHNGNLYIIFGTGGENDFNSGHIYKAPLSDLMNNDLSNAEILIESPQKGFVAPPSLADLNDDSVLDIIVNAYDGKIVAVSGLDNNIMWEAQIEGGETNASPGIGHFNDDNIPDVFSTYAIGLAPTFTDFRQVMIDGATGEILYNESVGFFQFNSPTVADLDQDGYDEVIMTTNDVNMQTFEATHEVRIFDFNDNTNEIVYGPLQGANVNSTALLSNIDNDGKLDFIYLHSQEASIGNTGAGLYLKKLSLDNTPDDIDIAWGGYIGTNFDGSYENLKEVCIESDYTTTIETTNVTCEGLGTATAQSTMCITGNCETIWFDENLQYIYGGATVENLEVGTDYVNIVNFDECQYYQQVIIENSENDIELAIDVTNASNCDANDGAVFINFTDGIPPYTTNFNGAASSPSNVSVYLQNNLTPGIYNFSVTDAVGCTTEQEITITPLPFEVNYEEQCIDEICAYQLQISGTTNYTATINGQTITNDNFLINTNGDYELIVEDENGCIYQETISVTTTAINELLEENFTFTHTTSQIILESDKKITSWQIMAINSQIIKHSNDISSKHQISTENMSRGLYFIKMEINNKFFARKFFIK